VLGHACEFSRPEKTERSSVIRSAPSIAKLTSAIKWNYIPFLKRVAKKKQEGKRSGGGPKLRPNDFEQGE
jgi:hypothetical protein